MKHFFAAFSLKIIACGIVIGSFAGCSVLDPAEEIPSYIRINSMSATALSGQGTSSSKITDAWIFVDDQLLGAYEMPCTLPVLAEGTHHVLIRAGIKMNGLSSTRAIYPFYKGWEGDVTLTRGQVTTISPSVNYFPATTFAWIEDFDQQGQGLITDQNISAQLIVDTVGAFEGKSAHVMLNADTTDYIGRSSNGYSMAANSEIYLELNYKCNETFTVGLADNVNTSLTFPWTVIAPSENWNKIYIRLTDAVADAAQAGGSGTYKVYVAMNRSSVDKPYLYLDNFKLLK